MKFEVFVDKFEAFVGINPFTMIFAWVNLLILYLFLKKLLFKPVKNMIDSRQKEIDDMYSDAEESRTDAAALKSEYEKKLENANEESEQILRNALRRAQLREEEILREADKKASRTLERAAEQAKEIGNGFLHEVAFLAIHSTLHLLGYDHELSAEHEEAQCKAQREIISQLEI